MKSTDEKQIALRNFSEWYSTLKTYSASGGTPAQGTIGAALVVLERLKTNCNLELKTHLTKGEGQISGASGGALRKVLAQFGETRQYIKEGGRTSRGTLGNIANMLDRLRRLNLDQLSSEQRNDIIRELQGFLVGKVGEFFGRRRLEVTFDLSVSTWQSIHNLLLKAREAFKEGPVAEYLVGAKLQLRFPDIQIRNSSYSTADDQLGHPGDFLVGDTAFHVTISPMFAVYEKCKSNIDNSYRVYLIVPSGKLAAARENAEEVTPGKIAVESIESFVSQNLEELSNFSKDRLAHGFYRLLTTYNERVDAVEIDKSMLIEIPRNLAQYSDQE
jgi:hypothetical protein